ncbi:MAG: tetratricopeptide repeat protein [Acidobacteriota bacterium]
MMNEVGQRVYFAAGVEILLAQGCIRRDGETFFLRPKSLAVLTYLLEQRQRLVTKDELIQEVWQGIAVTDDALVQAIVEIRKALGDNSRQPRFIKTFAKTGYRFIGNLDEIRTGSLIFEETEEITSVEYEIQEEIQNLPANREALFSPTPPRKPFLKTRWVQGVVMIAGCLIIGLSLYAGVKLLAAGRSTAEVTLSKAPGKKSVAVLFFENQSATAELDWLREGLADMMITNLSRSNRLSVLSRQQLHLLFERTGHQRAATVRLDEALDLAQKTQAEVIILGSFAKLGDQVRIDAQIHDTRTGNLIAAEGMTADTPDQILAGVDALSHKLTAHLGVTSVEKEQPFAAVMTDNINAYRYYSLALEQTQMFQFPEALELLEKAIALDSEFAMAYARIGYVYAVRLGQGDKAKPYFAKALELGERLSDKERLFIAAWSANANYDTEQAIKTYQELLEKYPLEVEAYQRLSWLLLAQENYEETLAVLKQGVIIDPEAKDLYNAMGETYQMQGKNDEAQAAFERYIQLAPQDPNAYDSLAAFYQWLGRYDEAIATYNHALTINPESGVNIIHLGHTYFQQGRYRAALEQYERLAQIAANDRQRARARECQAFVYLQKGDLKRATNLAKQVMRLNTLNNMSLLYTFLARGDRQAVENLKPEVLATIPFTQYKHRGFLRLFYSLQGTLALQEGKSIEAIEHFKETLRHRPLSWNIYSYEDCLAKAYLQLGQFDEAIDEFQRILKINPHYPLAHFYLAEAYARKGDGEQSLRYYREFLQTWKAADADIPEIITAKKRLAGLN